MKKYLSEITDVNKIDHELFNGFMESIGLSDEAVEEIIKQTEGGETPKMELFSYKVVDPIDTEGDRI